MTPVAPFVFFLTLFTIIIGALASPYRPLPTQFSRVGSPSPVALVERDDSGPQFPDQPPSCPICEQNYGNIDNCAEAAPVLQNFSMVSFSVLQLYAELQCCRI